jgi:predicted transcriptional regulator of viral defense system
MSIDSTLLRFLAHEEFCSLFEVEELIRLQGGSPDSVTRLLNSWHAQGWLESVSQGESHLPPLLRLTDQAYAAHPWLRRAT